MDNIKPQKGSRHKRKRIGRGNSSGHGTYSTRGLKGQKSRSGVSNLKLVGVKKQLRAVPKMRGFKSLKGKAQVFNLNDLNNSFKDNERVSLKLLVKKGIIDNIVQPVKLLGNGELKLKGLKLEGIKISASAKEQLEKMKGEIISPKS